MPRGRLAPCNQGGVPVAPDCRGTAFAMRSPCRDQPSARVSCRLTILYPRMLSSAGVMAHTIKDKQKLINRVGRIRGQIEGIEKALAREEDCSRILQTIAASRGAINGLMAEVVEDQIRVHVADPARLTAARRSRVTGTQHAKETDDLIAVIKTYLK